MIQNEEAFSIIANQSCRMQSEKGLVLNQNKVFIEHILAAGLLNSEKIQLVINSNGYDYLGCKMLKDIVVDNALWAEYIRLKFIQILRKIQFQF
jgi:molybdopterin-guanine dinucleotide biosynthesis protein A